MAVFKLQSAVEQVAAYLRTQLASGRWKDDMPGVYQLVEELQVSRSTVDGALQQLEKDGLLEGQGAGRRRRITAIGKPSPPSLRVHFLLYDDSSRHESNLVEIQHLLLEAGFHPIFAPKTLQGLGMDLKRVARYAQKVSTDAWIVQAGSREILQWFADRPVPAFAIFGAFSGLPLSAIGPLKIPAMIRAVRRLVALGHHRIMMLSRKERLQPKPALFERMFIKELEAHGIETGSYNLPLWEDTCADFHRCIDSLLSHSPPTALLMEEPFRFHAAKDHLARRGYIAPEKISLICLDPDPTFDWADPPVSHIRWDQTKIVRRVVRWTHNVARGKTSRLPSYIKAKFIEGGTVGPVPRKP